MGRRARLHPVSARYVGFGCMRLSTDPSRDPARAREVVRAAVAAGATLLDTADAYAWDEGERGHNERVIAGAGVANVLVATKGGLTRPGGKWVPDGRASHLRAACEASLRALSVGALDLYQLHAPDPQVPLATSVRALARLKDEGLVAAIGLSNVSAHQLEEAMDLAEIRSVQLALSSFDEGSLRGGVPELAKARGLLLLAHSPFGGPKRAPKIARDRVLAPLAAERGLTPHQLVLAWLYDLGAIPLPGATTIEHAREAALAGSIALDDAARRALDERFPLGRLLREPRSARKPGAGAEGEVVLLMGIPGAGKSTRVARFVADGYLRLNRDERGGTLRAITQALDVALASGERRVVLDNTYTTRALRHEVLEVAWRHRVPVRCVWLETPLEEAQINAVRRILERHGRLLSPEEMARATKKDPSAFDPRVQHRYARGLEPPHPDEGFSAIERASFVREADPRLVEAATIVSLDAFARLDAGGVTLDRRRVAILREHPGLLLATSWQPLCDRAAMEVAYAAIASALGRPLAIETCTHPAGPPICWCRKPLPGLALSLMARHRIDPARSRMIGTSAADRSIAARLGFPYADADAFFDFSGS